MGGEGQRLVGRADVLLTPEHVVCSFASLIAILQKFQKSTVWFPHLSRHRDRMACQGLVGVKDTERPLEVHPVTLRGARRMLGWVSARVPWHLFNRIARYMLVDRPGPDKEVMITARVRMHHPEQASPHPLIGGRRCQG